MAPTRVGLVGLASFETTDMRPHAWAVVSLLPSFIHSPDYEIVAVCNSTVESARRAIEIHKLPAATNAYGNPNDIANDPNVDLVAISVVVTKHFLLAEPALLKKKQVFVEWPLGASTQEAQALTDLAHKNNLKTIVGVQGRADSLVVKVKEIIDSGKLGKVTSSSVTASTSFVPSDIWFKGAEYYLDMGTGGNAFHIGFAHFLDSFTHVLGGFESLQSSLKTEITEIPIIGDDGQVERVATKNTPDHILVQGSLKSGAMASIAVRWADYQGAVDDVGFRWIITGTEGEIEVTTNQVPWQQNSSKRKLKLKLKGSASEEVDFASADADFVKHIPEIGVNTGRILDAFAKGDKSRYADFDSALETHKLLDEIIRQSGYKW